MLDPFLTGLLAGAAVGLAGLSHRLVRLAAVAAVGLLAWTAAQQGVDGLEETLAGFITNTVLPHGRLVVGAAVGVLLGAALLRGRR